MLMPLRGTGGAPTRVVGVLRGEVPAPKAAPAVYVFVVDSFSKQYSILHCGESGPEDPAAYEQAVIVCGHVLACFWENAPLVPAQTFIMRPRPLPRSLPSQVQEIATALFEREFTCAAAAANEIDLASPSSQISVSMSTPTASAAPVVVPGSELAHALAPGIGARDQMGPQHTLAQIKALLRGDKGVTLFRDSRVPVNEFRDFVNILVGGNTTMFPSSVRVIPGAEDYVQVHGTRNTRNFKNTLHIDAHEVPNLTDHLLRHRSSAFRRNDRLMCFLNDVMERTRCSVAYSAIRNQESLATLVKRFDSAEERAKLAAMAHMDQRKLTADQRELLADVSRAIHLCTKSLPFSEAEAREARLRLIAMFAAHGPPSFFLTLSPNASEWADVLRSTMGVACMAKLDELSHRWKERVEAARKDSAAQAEAFARWFEDVKALLGINANQRTGAFDKRETGVLGQVHQFFWKVEAQRQGGLHVHMLLWTDLSAARLKQLIDTRDVAGLKEFIQKVDGVMSSELDEEVAKMLNRHREANADARVPFASAGLSGFPRGANANGANDTVACFLDRFFQIVFQKQYHECRAECFVRSKCCKSGMPAPSCSRSTTVVHRSYTVV
jgi:hypothetical protein